LKDAIIRPIFKHGSKKEFKNYRPISILNSISKILEKHITTNLTSYLSKFKIIIKEQYAYQKNKSTTDLLIELVEMMNENLHLGKHVIALSIDLSKAYDVISHSKLLDAIEKVGIRGKVQDLLKNYLESRNFRVKVGSSFSKKIDIKQGIPQGSYLGPILYLLYVNDINRCFDYCKYFIYADDKLLISCHKNVKVAVSNLQKDFNNFQKWCHDKGLIINKDKTKLIHIVPPKGIREDIVITYHNYKCIHRNNINCKCECYIQRVDKIKYLGVFIDQNLDWSTHVLELSKKLKICMWRIQKVRDFLTYDTLKLIYFSLIESLIRYGLEIWGCSAKTNMNLVYNVQKKFMKYLSEKINFKSENYNDHFKKHNILAVKKLYEYQIINRNFFKEDFRKQIEHVYETRIKYNFIIPNAFNRFGERTLKVTVPKLLNNLPNQIIEIKSKTILKKKLKEWMLNS